MVVKCFSALVKKLVVFLSSVTMVDYIDQLFNYRRSLPASQIKSILCSSFYVLLNSTFLISKDFSVRIHEGYCFVVFFFISLSGFSIRRILALQNKLRSVASLWKGLYRSGANSSLFHRVLS